MTMTSFTEERDDCIDDDFLEEVITAVRLTCFVEHDPFDDEITQEVDCTDPDELGVHARG